MLLNVKVTGGLKKIMYKKTPVMKNPFCAFLFVLSLLLRKW